MDGFGGFDILFLALVAGFLILRLRSVLGQRTGTENPERWRSTRPQPLSGNSLPGNVTRMPDRTPDTRPPEIGPEAGIPAPVPPGGAPLGSVEAGVAQIRSADPSFDPRGFATGARQAFEMIVRAFAQGETATLRPLLSDEVYENFTAAIQDRRRARHTLETTLVGIKSADLVDARLNGRTAEVSIKFVSEQKNMTRDESGQVIDGSPDHVATVTDIWTFARNTRASDPNWTLIGTSAQN